MPKREGPWVNLRFGNSEGGGIQRLVDIEVLVKERGGLGE